MLHARRLLSRISDLLLVTVLTRSKKTHLHLCFAINLEIVQSILRDRRCCFIGEFDESNILFGGDGTNLDETGISDISVITPIGKFVPFDEVDKSCSVC